MESGLAISVLKAKAGLADESIGTPLPLAPLFGWVVWTNEPD